MTEQLHPALELKFLSHQSEKEHEEGWKWPLQTRLFPFDSSVARTQFSSGLCKVGAFPLLGNHLPYLVPHITGHISARL